MTPNCCTFQALLSSFYCLFLFSFFKSVLAIPGHSFAFPSLSLSNYFPSDLLLLIFGLGNVIIKLARTGSCSVVIQPGTRVGGPLTAKCVSFCGWTL